jgi:raffinose/stachyose/melibiose transport system permease protein
MWFLVVFLLGNMLPQEALAYPLFYVARELDVYDTLIPVIVIFIAIHTALGTYLLTSVLLKFPREIIEAAQVDGAGKWRVLWRVVGPLSRPTLMVLFVFFFIWTWNELFMPLIFLVSNDHQTVPEALAVLQSQYYNNTTVSSAGALLGAIPAIVFFFLFQRTLVKGITAGALK